MLPEQQTLWGDVSFTDTFTDKGNRRLHDIALDVSNPLHKWLHESINWLSARRLFQSTIRDALRLILDLRAGGVDVLLELFPWVKDKFSTGNEELLEQIKVLLAARGAVALPAPQNDLPNRAPSSKEPLPELEITTAKEELVAGLNPSVMNFYKSMDALTGSNMAGAQLAKHQEAQAAKEGAYLSAPKQEPVASRQIAGSDIELPPPDDFEDIPL